MLVALSVDLLNSVWNYFDVISRLYLPQKLNIFLKQNAFVSVPV